MLSQRALKVNLSLLCIPIPPRPHVKFYKAYFQRFCNRSFTHFPHFLQLNSGETNYGLHIKRDSGSSSFMIKLENEDASATDASMFGIFHQGDGDFSIGESYSDPKFHINGNDNGYVGIGSSLPAGLLLLEADMSVSSYNALLMIQRNYTSITDGEELGAICFG